MVILQIQLKDIFHFKIQHDFKYKYSPYMIVMTSEYK
jgi:hypothetical protein